MVYMFKKFLSNQLGYGAIELLLIIAAVALISGTVAGKISPSFENCHEKVKKSIIEINETGF